MEINNSKEITDSKLKDALNAWVERGTLPPELSLKLKETVSKKARQERKQRFVLWSSGGIAAAILLLIISIVTLPGVRTWAAENIPLIGKYIESWTETEKGWLWADKEEAFQKVASTASDKGYTFSVEKILADPISTAVFFTLESDSFKESDEANISVFFKEDSIIFHNESRRDETILNYFEENNLKPVIIEKVLFNGYRLTERWGMRGEMTDGVYMGVMELGKLPEKEGELELVIGEIGDIEGDWRVTVPVKRDDFTEIAQTLRLNESFEIPGGELTLRTMELVPTQTKAVLRYKGENDPPRNIAFRINGEEIEKRSGRSTGGSSGWLGNDIRTHKYRLHYQPVESLSHHSEITIEVLGFVTRDGETRLPLKKGEKVKSPLDKMVWINDYSADKNEGRAEIAFELYENNGSPFWFPQWKVVDDKGDIHQTSYPASQDWKQTTEKPQANSGEGRQTVEWQLPHNRVAVAIINPEYQSYENIGEVTINLAEVD